MPSRASRSGSNKPRAFTRGALGLALVLGAAGSMASCGGLTEETVPGGGAGAQGLPPGSYVQLTQVAMGNGAGAHTGLCVSAAVRQLDCTLVDASESGTSCGCDAEGMRPVSSDRRERVLERLAGTGCDASGRPACSALCLCEWLPSSSEQCDAASTEPGYCAAWSLDCASDRPLRYSFGSVNPRRALLSCELLLEPPAARTPNPKPPGPLGAPCTPEFELTSAEYLGADMVSVDVGSSECESGICVANRFQGRTQCPYGATGSPECPDVSYPYGTAPPQLSNWREADAVTCSCRCDGPNPCACPEGLVCEPLLERTGGSLDVAAGSYCVKPRPAKPGAECAGSNCD